MEENKLIKILIPVIAAVVIFESVVLVSNLDKKGGVVVEDISKKEIPLEEVVKKEEPVADFVFAIDTKEIEVGENYEVSLNLIGKKNFNLDGIQTYIKYDPKLVTVSKLVSGSTLPKPVRSEINSKNGLISNVVIIEGSIEDYYSVKMNEINKIESFMVTPKVEGLISFELVTVGDVTPVTKIVETGTSKSLVFLSNILEVNVTK